MDREEAIRNLQSLRYHADFAIAYIKGNVGLRNVGINERQEHPNALFCIGPFAVYERFKESKPPPAITFKKLVVNL